MLTQVIEVFKNSFEDLDKVIIDGYIPAEGTYIMVEPDNNEELKITCHIDIEMNKKTREVDITLDRFSDFCTLDYNSKLIDMNKPIDSKKIIHSNNFLSFFVKKESFIIDEKSGQRKLTEEIIDGYYDVLKNPISKYGKKAKAKELYESVEAEIGKVDLEKLEIVKGWIKENIFTLQFDKNKKNYLKIFFLFDKADFTKEGNRYLIPNVYNNNDFNIKDNSNILGLPNDNMGLNSKKPYLENKTRKVKVPYLIDQKEALLQKKFFDYLYNLACQGKNHIYVDNTIRAIGLKDEFDEDFSGMYLRIQKGKETEIQDFDVISRYSPTLNKPFNFINYLDIPYESLYGKEASFEYGKFTKLSDVKHLINNIIFSNYLLNSLFADSLNISDKVLERAILKSREQLIQWFYKGNHYNVWSVLDKVSKDIIKETIMKEYIPKSRNQFNLRYSLMQFFKEGEEDMADVIKCVKESLRKKINEKEESYIESDKEYFFAVGQLSYYLLNKSNGKNKPMSLLNPIINGRTNEVIKTKLKQLFKKYNYDLDMNRDLRVKKLYEVIISYEIEGKINDDLIIAGYLSNSLIYEKKED